MRRYNSVPGKIFDVFNFLWLSLMCLITIYPFIYVFSASISTPVYVETNSVFFYPIQPTLAAYRRILSDFTVARAYYNTIIYALGGAFFGVVVTYLVAYPLSKTRFIWCAFFTFFVTFTMFFSGGMIPKYLVVNALGMVNTRWAVFIPHAASAWYVLLVRNYLKSIPESLEESALIDGANEGIILVKIIMPLSLPILATVALFCLISEWNSFMTPLIYLQDSRKFPLQIILYRLVILSEMADFEETLDQIRTRPIVTIRYAVIFVSLIPLLMVYPFVQRFFVKGIIVGAIKG